MGSGASSRLDEAIQSATPDELREVLSALQPADLKWITELHSVAGLSADEIATLGAKYSSLDTFKSALQRRATTLLKGTWMIDHETSSVNPLPRRQDLSPGASWEVEDLLPKLPPSAVWRERDLGVEQIPSKPVAVVGISYCWETQRHPDPHRKMLKLLAQTARLRIKYRRKQPVSDLAMFLDFCSLYQAVRTEEEDAAFKQELHCVNVWYGHNLVEKWMFTALPRDAPADMLPYSQRGWPQFEQTVCELQSAFDHLLDLGRLQEQQFSQVVDFEEIRQACMVRKRQLPLMPHEMRAKLQALTFTNGADRGHVVKIYARTCEEVLGTSETLDFYDRGWGPEEMSTLLSKVLSRCHNLRELRLGRNSIDGQVCKFLRKSTFASQLERLDIKATGIGSDELAILLQGSWPSLESLQLDSNNLVDASTQLLVAALPRMPKLKTLNVEKNCKLTDKGKQVLQQSWIGKPECLHLNP